MGLLTAMTSNLHRSEQTRLRTTLMQMLAEFNASHQITLTFNKHYNLQRATARVTKWYHIVMRQLYGRNWSALPPNQRIEFLLLPEMAKHLHFHGVIRIPESHVTYFTKIAAAKWKFIVPTSTFFYGDFYSDMPRDYYFRYITYGSLALEFLHSSMLPLPGVIPELPNGNTNHKFQMDRSCQGNGLHGPAPTSASRINGIH